MRVHENAALESLAGLERLRQVGGDLSVNYNPRLVGVEAFVAGLEVGGAVDASGNGD